MEDKEIIKELKKNNDDVVRNLMDKYAGYVFSIASQMGGAFLSAQDIEEIMSDVFISVWKSRYKLLDGNSLKPYIAQITRNETIDRLRKYKEELPLEEDILSFSTSGLEEQITDKMQLEFIKEIVARFPSPDNDIFISYYFCNFKLSDIANKFNIPLSTVKTKLYRLRDSLIKQFEKGGYHYEG